MSFADARHAYETVTTLHASPHQTPRIRKYVMLPHHHITTYEYSHFNSVILTSKT
jgi:hypothetical protein